MRFSELFELDFGKELSGIKLEELKQADFEEAISLVDKARHDRLLKEDSVELKEVAIALLLLNASGAGSLNKVFLQRMSFKARMGLQKGDFESVFKKFFPSAEFLGNEVKVHYLEIANLSALSEFELERGYALLSNEDSGITLQKALEAKLSSLKLKQVPELLEKQAKNLKYLEPERFSSRKGLQFLEVNCVKKALNGMREGKRYYGSMAIAIACLKDGLEKDRAENVIKQYALNCQKIQSDFTEREALNALDWVYSKKAMGFSCQLARGQGLADINIECQGCPLYKSAKRR